MVTDYWLQNQKIKYRVLINPLSPNSDQDQISPNNIHTLSRDKL